MHEKEFQEWRDETPSCPTFVELDESSGAKSRRHQM
jgi:hypothetical protein